MNERKTIRIIIYSIELLICFSLQGIVGLIPDIMGCTPLLTVACVSSLVLFESSDIAIIFSMICGIFIDISISDIVGPYGIIMSIIAFIFSYVSNEIFMKRSLFCVIASLLICLISVFAYNAGCMLYLGVEYDSLNFVMTSLIKSGYTFLFALLFCCINSSIEKLKER
ncbi:MAG: rod shape-determining protein MreD [Clostridia bacterium]|nr:rod shape-determining protein MreD [Clostridia bacterium]